MSNFDQEKSFKEQILAEMQEASRQREARRQELLAQEAKARQEAEEAARLAEEARLEAERQAQLAAERQAQLEAEEARRQAELEELARQEEEARRQAELEAARLEEERRRAEEAARLEAERQAQLAAEEARRQAELEELARREEELRRLEEAARLEAERQAVERQARQEEFMRRQAELEAARQTELSRIEAEERELARLEEARQRHLEELARLEAEQAQLAEVDFADSDLTWEEENLEDTISETAIPTFQEEPEPVEVAGLGEFSESDVATVEDDDVLEPEDKVLPVVDQRRKNSQLANKISLFLGTIIVLMLLATAILGYRYVSSAIKPLDKTSTEFVQVEIPNGSGNKLIGQILEEEGVIKSGAIFNYYTKFKNYTNFQSGYYNFQKSMSLDEISQLLQEGGTPEPVVPALGKIVIPEGYTLTQIANAVTKNSAAKEGADNSTPFTSEDFLAVVQDETFIAQMMEKYPLLLASLPDASLVKYQLEGYLFPATYSYYEESTVADIVDQMLGAMDSNLAVYYDAIANSGRTVNDILTLASLVEKEGATDGDRKMIASVFYNRLSINMPLQSNIAILYAMDKLGEKTTLLEDATIDTAIDSPYNIYQNYGLMPGAVDNAGLSAIQATIEPDETDYLYFVADVTTGQVYYAETYEEHTANVEQYVNSNL